MGMQCKYFREINMSSKFYTFSLMALMDSEKNLCKFYLKHWAKPNYMQIGPQQMNIPGAQSIHELGAVGSLAARPGDFGLVEETARTRVKN